LKVLEELFGKDSSCYSDLYESIQSGPPRYGFDPRGQVISPEQYQQEMDERTTRYQKTLAKCQKQFEKDKYGKSS
jgi:hypothetical protein